MTQQAHPREGRARAGAGHHVQGELPGHPQLEGHRRGARAAEVRRARSTSTIRGPTAAECKHEYGMRPVRDACAARRYDAIVLRRGSHREFRELGADGVRKLGKKNHVMYDIKHVFRSDESDGRL